MIGDEPGGYAEDSPVQGPYDRPWFTAVPGRLTKAGVREWRKSADSLRPSCGPVTFDNAVEADPGDDDHEPGITVITPSYMGRERIGRCLQSLAEQTLDPGLFELVVVLNGPPDGTRQILQDFRERHPDICLRIVESSMSGASRAWNAGIAAATRQYTTFVDDDDYVSPRFLEVLLANAGPRVISMANIVDVSPSGDNDDNYINRAVVRFAGQLMAPADLLVGTSSNAPKAVATALIKDIRYPADFQSGQDVVFWTTVATSSDVQFYPCHAADGAVYYRVLRDESMSRQPMTFDFNVRQRLEVISHLDRLVPHAAGRNRDLVLDRMKAQAGFIRSFLRDNPTTHPAVVDLVDRSRIADMPYASMNGLLARGLVVAYAFPPYADTSAIVMAKRIRARGEVVDVVYNKMDRIRDRDERTRQICGPYLGQEAGLSTPTSFASWEAIEQFSVEGMKTISRWVANKGPYEWAHSRAQFPASHFLAAAHKLAYPQSTWIAEFSDPISRDVNNVVRGVAVPNTRFAKELRSSLLRLDLPLPDVDNAFVWCEEIAYALADQLLFTNVQQRDHMLSYCSNARLAELARNKAVVAPQPTLPLDFYTRLDSQYRLTDRAVNLAYFGAFYSTRDLDDILLALAGAEPAIQSRLRLHVFTSKPSSLVDRLASLGLSEVVAANSYVEYFEFLNLTTKVDYLIVNDASTSGSHQFNPYLPSKLSDYVGSGTRVWGLVEAGSPLSGHALDFASPIGDVSAARAVLTRMVAEKFSEIPTVVTLET